MSKDSIGKTFAVALGLCLVCAIIVSSAATLLKGKQEKNKLLDKQTNVLKAAGLVSLDASLSAAQVKELFSRVEPVVVDLATGKADSEADPENFETGMIVLSSQNDLAGVKKHPEKVVIYLVKDNEGKMKNVILPIFGHGLWSTMRGFLALQSDLTTVENLTFYEHGETPGLGGEISNPAWVGKWAGKKALDNKGQPVIRVIKGTVDSESPSAAMQIDGISGATLTCNGVNNTVKYWLSDAGFGKFLKEFRARN